MALTAPWALFAAAGPLNRNAHAQRAPARFGPPVPFSFQRLRDRAAAMAKQEHVPPPAPAPEIVKTIDFDTAQAITYRPEAALWGDRSGAFPVRFFHLHRYVGAPVKISAVTGDTARELLYDERYFDYGETGLAAKLPDDLGFAGFRVMDGPNADTDWLAFQGATYFRSSGASNQYGASARGIAVNTALETKEEFPAFTEFWLEPLPERPGAIAIHALLDGPSETGAYRFDAVRGDSVVMDVHAELFVRKDLRRFGIAPLTSMYWYGENDRRRADDWRPEIHDSDGLALWTGGGERIFRPLINPPSVQVNTFMDDGLKGFGLVQRDRDFDHYQDDGAFYDRRPSIWVEPKGDWGKGSVQLVEIPTDDEIHDNIVAFWQPDDTAETGDGFTFDYRLHWRNRQPYPPDTVGQVVATRTGRGGVAGQSRQESEGLRKFVIDFEGGPLGEMEQRFDVTPVVTASRGTVSNGYVIKVVGTKRWRAAFDLRAEGKEPVDLRCFLRLGDRTLSETWLYQYFPEADTRRN